jgi:hypothetical protein
VIARTHVERWLDRNRARLTAPGTKVFEEIAAFITPEIYRRPPDRTYDERDKALMATMRCRVSPEDVNEATNVLDSSRNLAASKPR